MPKKSLFDLRLKKQARLHHKSINQVERDLGYPRNALNSYQNGRKPSGERLVELADYFMVSPHYLIGKRQVPNNGTLREQFQSLSFDEKREMYSLCQKWAYSQLSQPAAPEITHQFERAKKNEYL